MTLPMSLEVYILSSRANTGFLHNNYFVWGKEKSPIMLVE